MARRISHYNLSGIPSDVVREYNTLPAARMLTTGLTQIEVAILEGDFFRSFKVLTIPATSSVYMKFTAPPAGKAFGLVYREITPSLSGIWYRVYRGSVATVAPNSEWPIFNENGYSSKVSGAKFEQVATVTNIGQLSDIAYIPKGATNKTQGSLDRAEGFKVIPLDTELLVEFQNIENQENEVLIYYQWVEAPSEITGV